MRKSGGFTIVELLIVVVVIAILAAITIVSFSGIQNRARDSSVQSDLRAFNTLVSNFMNDPEAPGYTGVYPLATASTLEPLGYKVNRGAYNTSQINLLYCINTANTGRPTEYALLSMSLSGKKMYIDQSGSVKEYTGSDTWLSTNYTARCQSVNNNLTGSYYAGFNSGSSPQWRAFTGPN